jgi:hypothetical protein
LLAVKKNFEKLFAQHEKNPGEYLQQNKVNFKNDTDLLALLAWLQN